MDYNINNIEDFKKTAKKSFEKILPAFINKFAIRKLDCITTDKYDLAIRIIKDMMKRLNIRPPKQKKAGGNRKTRKRRGGNAELELMAGMLFLFVVLISALLVIALPVFMVASCINSCADSGGLEPYVEGKATRGRRRRQRLTTNANRDEIERRRRRIEKRGRSPSRDAERGYSGDSRTVKVTPTGEISNPDRVNWEFEPVDRTDGIENDPYDERAIQAAVTEAEFSRDDAAASAAAATSGSYHTFTHEGAEGNPGYMTPKDAEDDTAAQRRMRIQDNIDNAHHVGGPFSGFGLRNRRTRTSSKGKKKKAGGGKKRRKKKTRKI